MEEENQIQSVLADLFEPCNSLRTSSALSMRELSLHGAFDFIDVVTWRGWCDTLISGKLDLLGHL